MSKVILGIHGLSNKPEKDVLEGWWRKSIVEGLMNVGHADAEFDFHIVFWADYLHKYREHTDENFSFDKLYNSEPYRAASDGELKEYKEGLGAWFRAAALDIGGSGIDFLKSHAGMNRFADWAISKVAKDLAFYYYNDERFIPDHEGKPRRAKDLLRDELKKAIGPEHEKGNEIMVVAHSMGAIIAYDALRDIGIEPGNTVEVKQFTTIGAPLGLPHVKGKIIEERNYDPKVRTPSIVTEKWTNFADPKDLIALDSRLRNDYGANQCGVRVTDDEVANDYHTGLPHGRGQESP